MEDNLLLGRLGRLIRLEDDLKIDTIRFHGKFAIPCDPKLVATSGQVIEEIMSRALSANDLCLD